MPKFGLHEAQAKVFEDTARFVVLVAGRRFGKTYLSLIDLLYSAKSNKSRCWYIAPTYRQAEMIAWKMLLEMIPQGFITKKDETRLEIILENGSEIALKGADNEDSLRGAGLNFVVLDEYAMMKVNVWQEIVRPMLSDTRGRALFIGTPKGKNHFFDIYLKGLRHEDGYSAHSFKTENNPFIMLEEVEEAKKQLSDRYFKQEYEASFEDYTGVVWPEYDEKLHIIAPYEVPNAFTRVCAIDPAISGTTAAVFAAFDEDDNAIIYDEYYEANKRASEVCEALIAKGRANRYIIDPAAKIKNQVKEGRLYTLFDEYSDNGIYATAGENNVDGGINRVAEYFKANRVKIFSTCKHLIYEIERYHWAEERETTLGISKPVPFKKDDHACDALRYLIMSRQSPTIIDKTPKPEPHSLKAYLEMSSSKHKQEFV